MKLNSSAKVKINPKFLFQQTLLIILIVIVPYLIFYTSEEKIHLPWNLDDFEKATSLNDFVDGKKIYWSMTPDQASSFLTPLSKERVSFFEHKVFQSKSDKRQAYHFSEMGAFYSSDRIKMLFAGTKIIVPIKEATKIFSSAEKRKKYFTSEQYSEGDFDPDLKLFLQNKFSYLDFLRGGKPLTQTKENEKKYKGDFLILENFFPFGKTINFWAEIGKSEFNLYLLDTSVSPLKKYFLKNLLISTSDEVQLKQFLGHKKLLNHEVFMILAAIYILVNFLLFYLGKSKNLAKENR